MLRAAIWDGCELGIAGAVIGWHFGHAPSLVRVLVLHPCAHMCYVLSCRYTGCSPHVWISQRTGIQLPEASFIMHISSQAAIINLFDASLIGLGWVDLADQVVGGALYAWCMLISGGVMSKIMPSGTLSRRTENAAILTTSSCIYLMILECWRAFALSI